MIMLLSRCGSDQAGAASSGASRDPADAEHRLVLVIDPTVLRDAETTEFQRLISTELRSSFGNLPEDTWVDVYFVGNGQVGLPADLRDSLPFNEAEATEAGHQKRAVALGDSVAQLTEARWAALNEAPNQPASCILTALYRAQEMIQDGAGRGQRVSVVVISDFWEACSDFGRFNFERTIPDSVGLLPAEADLSGADQVLMVRVQKQGTGKIEDVAGLERVWRQILTRWKVDASRIHFQSEFPDDLLQLGKMER